MKRAPSYYFFMRTSATLPTLIANLPVRTALPSISFLSVGAALAVEASKSCEFHLACHSLTHFRHTSLGQPTDHERDSTDAPTVEGVGARVERLAAKAGEKGV